MRLELGPDNSPILYVTLPWDDKYYDVIREKRVTALVITEDSRDWPPPADPLQIDFARALCGITRLTFSPWRPIESLEPLGGLQQLRSIGLGVRWLQPFDWSRLGALEKASLVWGANATDVLHCPRLIKLRLVESRLKTIDGLPPHATLQSLQISKGRFETENGIQRFESLRELSLPYCRKLRAISELPQLERLESLDITGCRAIETLDTIGMIHQLRHLDFSSLGTVDSLAPLRGCGELRNLYFDGSTNITDGDLSPLLDLPHITMLNFKNRSHYSHRYKEIIEIIESRW